MTAHSINTAITAPKAFDKKRLAFKISECAELTGLSQATIRRAITRGLLKPCRAFRHPLIPADQLHAMINGR